MYVYIYIYICLGLPAAAAVHRPVDLVVEALVADALENGSVGP